MNMPQCYTIHTQPVLFSNWNTISDLLPLTDLCLFYLQPLSQKYNESIKQCLGVLSNSRYVRYEVLILKLLEHHAFWDVKPCQLVSRYGCLEGQYHFHLQGQAVLGEKRTMIPQNSTNYLPVDTSNSPEDGVHL
jgi:hypothetical protein